MQAKKSFGQHFLTNEKIALRVADAIDAFLPINNLLEVGPGKGMLTKYLLKKSSHLLLVEADKDMLDILNQNQSFKEADTILADFLQLDFKKIYGVQSFYIIGNFPYNISSQIIFKMLENKESIPGMVGMFQKEMAIRVAEPPGSREYGVISVLTQAYFDVEYLFTINEGNFNPPPKVKSAVLRFTRKPKQNLDCDEILFKKVVKTAFQLKRKMLRNSLRNLISPELIKDPFFEQRPEQLSVADFVRITNLIK